MGQQTSSSKCSVAGKAVGVPVAGKAVGSWVPVNVGSFLFLDVLHLSSSLLLFDPRNRNRTGDGRKIREGAVRPVSLSLSWTGRVPV